MVSASGVLQETATTAPITSNNFLAGGVWSGLVWRGAARHGLARQGEVGHVTVRYGLAGVVGGTIFLGGSCYD